MRILIIGGHFSPALSIIENLPKDTSILYAGRKYSLEGENTLSLEYQAIKARNIQFATITTGRLQRKLTKHTLSSLFKLPIGFIQAWKIIQQFKPTIILGFGSYVQVPLCVVGFLLGIPVVIHEQTLEAGLANRLTAKFATKVCMSWPSSSTFFPRNKIILTGNPAVSNLMEHFPYSTQDDKEKNKIPTILIVGGSQGSHAINMIVQQTLPELLQHYAIIHQTGDAKEFLDFNILQKEQAKLPQMLQKNYTLAKFFDPKKIIEIFQQADIVISRAGINTITTLLVLGKPSLLIPLPVSQNNEQQKNALFLKDHGLGEVLSQNSLTNQSFLSAIHAMIKNRKNYYNKRNLNELMFHKDATKKIIETVIYAQKNSSQKKN